MFGDLFIDRSTVANYRAAHERLPLASGRCGSQQDPCLAWSCEPRHHQHLRRDRSRDEGKGDGALRCRRARTRSPVEGEQGADGLPWRTVIEARYVADKTRIFMFSAAIPALRNIIRAATYAQQRARTNRFGSSRASLA